MNYVCLFLPYPPTVNNLFVNSKKAGGRFPSKAYKAWQEEAAVTLGKQDVKPIHGPVSLTFTFGRPDKRRRDVFNLVKAPEDFLVKHGIIEDDSLVERGTVQWSPHVFGVRIEIEPFVEEAAA
jgi:crossover junction endodeoxyribonuclease RusA